MDGNRSSEIFAAPPRSGFWSKLGPGGFASLLLAMASGLLLLGIPVWWRLREVLGAAHGEPPAPSDLILVLGRKLEEDLPTPVFTARLSHGADLWRSGLAPRIIVAGGLTGDATRTEAEAGRAWLEAQGVRPGSILTEDRSQHTLENLFNLRKTMRQEGWSSLLLVSDSLHLARAGALARGLGLQARCSPAGACPPASGTAGWWLRAFHEAFLLHWYYTGMLYSRVIRSERQLARVT
jgi:uncharacterized SAM-binding protein YcdF (DUF218 family)